MKLNEQISVSRFEYWFLKACSIVMFFVSAILLFLLAGYWMEDKAPERKPYVEPMTRQAHLPKKSVYQQAPPLNPENRIRSYEFIEDAKQSSAKPGRVVPGNAANAESLPTATVTGFVVQVSASQSKNDSDSLRAELILKNYPAQLFEDKDKKMFYVRIGPYNKRSDAEQIEKNLKKDGYKTFMITPKQTR